MIKIKLDFAQAAGEYRASEKAIQKAVVSTLNKLTERAKTSGIQAITETYNIKRKDLVNDSNGNARIKIYKARQNSEAAILEVKGRPISFAYLGAKQTDKTGKKVVTVKGTKVLKRTGSKFSGVTVEVIKGKKTELPGGFLAKTKSGHTGVFQRTAGSVMKSRSKYGGTKHAEKIHDHALPSVASLFGGRKVLSAIEERVNRDAVKVFRHELEYYIGKEL